MSELRGGEDVYKIFVEDSEDRWLFGLVAFAIVEEQRIEWQKHFRELNSVDPTAQDVERWYREQSNGALLRAKGDAENALNAFSQDLREQFIEDEHAEIAQGLVISEIRHASRYWPQFLINVAAGTISAFLFAIILTAFALLIATDASPVKILKDASKAISQPVESDDAKSPRK